MLPRWPGGQESTCQSTRRHGFDPWVVKIPWRRKWQPTPEFLPGKSHGQRSLAGCIPWGPKESHRTQQVNNNNYKTTSKGPSFFFLGSFFLNLSNSRSTVIKSSQTTKQCTKTGHVVGTHSVLALVSLSQVNKYFLNVLDLILQNIWEAQGSDAYDPSQGHLI